jgi:protease IV
MTFETETVLDRRRLRRRVSWWRALAIIAAVLVIGLVSAKTAERTGLTESRHIARVSIENLITEDRAQLKMLQNIAESKQVAGVILFVNSPGGTTTGGEALFAAIRNVAKDKPVVAQFGTLATSAAYIAGLATDYVVARGNTITGSVGVIFQWAEVTQLLDKIGVKMNEVKSGPLKANPSPFQPLDDAGKAAAEQMVADSQKWFVGLVASRRNIDTRSVTGLEQGRIFSGREALTYKLIDEIGGEAEAVQWLEQKRDVPKGLKVVDWKPKRGSDWTWVGASAAVIGYLFGDRIGGEFAQLLSNDHSFGTMRLDGLVSVWHASER